MTGHNNPVRCADPTPTGAGLHLTDNGYRERLDMSAPLLQPTRSIAHGAPPSAAKSGWPAANFGVRNESLGGTRGERSTANRGLRWPELTHQDELMDRLLGSSISLLSLRKPRYLAEREGFEPPMDGYAHTGFRVRCGSQSPAARQRVDSASIRFRPAAIAVYREYTLETVQ
jgi:hypothetical protein